MPHPTGQGKAWLILLSLISGGLLIYLGVSLSPPGPPAAVTSPGDPARRPLLFAEWSDATWKEAADRRRLVLLLVADSLVMRSREVEKILADDASIQALLGSHYLPVRVDRRARPDLAERYAENQIPHLSVLLPSGEALARITGEPESWSGQLVETERYWRDHQDEIHSRTLSFWEEIEADSAGQVARPDAADIPAIDSCLFALLDTLLSSPSPGPALWRTDFDRYLAARGGAQADSLRKALRAARGLHADSLQHALLAEATPAAWARTLIELKLFDGHDLPDAPAELQLWFAQNGGPRTAEEFACTQWLARLLQQELRPSYPGTWLGLDSVSASALPHLRHKSEPLDGYLMDAIAWLEFLLEDPELVPCAARLADSLWSNLWDPRARALCDKPQSAGPVRERRVYPRAQLGRVALLLDRLAGASGLSRFSARADSCLAGFAPYVRQAMSASTYYGEALLLRGKPPGRGNVAGAETSENGAGTI